MLVKLYTKLSVENISTLIYCTLKENEFIGHRTAVETPAVDSKLKLHIYTLTNISL